MSTIPPTTVTINKDELEKMLADAKSNDLTRAQFEREKTGRIQALAGLMANPPWQIAGQLGQFISKLEAIIDSKYEQSN